jgi:hypothetical protein
MPLRADGLLLGDPNFLLSVPSLRDHLLRQGSGILFVDTRLIDGVYEQPLHFDG